MSIEYVISKKDKNTKFTVHEFDQMSEFKKDTLRGTICCPKCYADAGYRKPSSDGKISCFFAKHVLGCEWSTSSNGKNENGDEETNILEVDTSVFGVKWNYKKGKKNKSSIDFVNTGNSDTSTGVNYVKTPSIKTYSKLSLSQILTYAEINKLNDIELELKINGKTYEISDVVHNVSEINDSFIGKRFFFWGEMKYYNKNFINLRNSSDNSVYITPSIADEFESRYKNYFFEVQKSNLMILFGTIRKSKHNNKRLIILDNCNKIYFRKK